MWLLFEKEKLDTAGGCLEEETCFTLPERFLHLILSGKVREWVSKTVVSDKSRSMAADLSLALWLISNLIIFFPL